MTQLLFKNARDIWLLAADGKNLRAIVRAGELVKNELR